MFKLNAIRAFMLAALIIILLYAFGLFLPIMKNSKPQSNIYNFENYFIVKKNV